MVWPLWCIAIQFIGNQWLCKSPWWCQNDITMHSWAPPKPHSIFSEICNSQAVAPPKPESLQPETQEVWILNVLHNTRSIATSHSIKRTKSSLPKLSQCANTMGQSMWAHYNIQCKFSTLLVIALHDSQIWQQDSTMCFKAEKKVPQWPDFPW